MTSPAILAFLAALSLPVSASAQTLTGTILGTVRDDSGLVLADVTVTLSSPALMSAVKTVTDAAGDFLFAALPPGEYAILFTREGFQAVRREGLRVGAESTSTVDVGLTLAVAEAVTVVRRTAGLDRYRTALAVSYDARELADLPGSRSILSILAATPAVHVARIEVGGNTGAIGGFYSAYGTSGANRPVVEGIGVAGFAPAGFTLDYGSFEEVSVGTGAHSAEWPAPGVQMQLVGKAGGNEYHGSVYADYENAAWQSINIDASQIGRGLQGASGLAAREINRLDSYYDVNADVGGYLKRDRAWWYGSLRRQDVATRLVNLPAVPYRTLLANYNGKVTYQPGANDKLVGFVQAGRNHQPTRGDPFAQAGGGLTVATVINDAVSATTDHIAWGWVWKGEWNRVIRSNLLLDARAGGFGANRSETPNGTEDRFEDISSLVVRGGSRDWGRDLRRGQVAGAISYFKSGWLGTHTIKTGGEAARIVEAEMWRTSYPRDVLHVLSGGIPRDVFLFDQTPSGAESGLWTFGAYGSDAWRLRPRVTLNLGVRFDRYRAFLPAQNHPAAPNQQVTSFPPVDSLIARNRINVRTGASFDASGDGRTVVKVTYGTYSVGPGTELGFNANRNASLWWRRYPWVDWNLNGAWDLGEESTTAIREIRGGAALESLDPGLELPLLTEMAGWVEREWAPGLVIRTGVVWRGEQHHYARRNVNQPFDAFTIPISIPDPGPDGSFSTPDDPPPIRGFALRPDLVGVPPAHEVRNVPGADARYWTWEAVATKRDSGDWSFTASFSHTWTEEHANMFGGQAVRQNALPLTPNDLINANEGGAYDYRVWSAKVYGTYEAPWGLRFTPFLRHQSGQPFGRTFVAPLNYGNVRILAEPIGTRRTDNITLTDLRAEKVFRFGNTRRLAAFVDVFNVLNTNPEQSTNWGSTMFLRPITIVAPRIARIGLKADW